MEVPCCADVVTLAGQPLELRSFPQRENDGGGPRSSHSKWGGSVPTSVGCLLSQVIFTTLLMCQIISVPSKEGSLLWSFKKTDFKRGNGGVGNSRDHPSTEATMKLGTDPSQNQLPGDTRTDETLTATRGECPIFGETAAGESHLPLFPRVAGCSHGGQ